MNGSGTLDICDLKRQFQLDDNGVKGEPEKFLDRDLDARSDSPDLR